MLYEVDNVVSGPRVILTTVSFIPKLNLTIDDYT